MKKIIVYAVTLVTLSIITMFIFNSKYKIVQNHNTKLKLPTLIWTYYEEEVIKKSQSYPYYIIRYVDSKHCIPCKLSYQELQHIFDMVNAKQKLLGAKIIFNSKDKNLIWSLAKKENITFPIAMDSTSSICKLNRCLRNIDNGYILIDKDYNILAIGNPLTNKDVREVYDRLFANSFAKSFELTKGEISSRILELGTINGKEKFDTCIYLYNYGKRPLVINDFITACGCLKISIKDKVIFPMHKAKCFVSIKPDKGFFQKNVSILSNSEDPLHFKVEGNAI